MPRRRVAEKREVLPDPIYNSVVVTKFINGLMWTGKKTIAEQIFYGAMEKIGEKTGEEPLKVFKRRNRYTLLRPLKSNPVESAVRHIRFRSRLARDRRNTLAIRWIVTNARKPKRKDNGQTDSSANCSTR